MYGKIFDSIYDGTLRANWQALVTFQQLIILADKDGIVDMTPHAIHGRTGIPLDIIEAGIDHLSKPDPYSRSHTEEGRRIVLLDDHRPWGWRLVNHAYYSRLRSIEEKREADRDRIAAKRDAKKPDKSGVSQDVAKSRGESQQVADVAPVSVSVTVDVTEESKAENRRHVFTADDKTTAEWMWRLVHAAFPSGKQPNLERWASEIRLIREADGRSSAEIRSLFEWANRHNFWQSNIRSPGKLREKWDTLEAQRSRPAVKPQQPENKPPRAFPKQ